MPRTRPRPRPAPAAADQLRAVRDLSARGWAPEDIARVLRVSLRTYYRRAAQLERLAARLVS